MITNLKDWSKFINKGKLINESIEQDSRLSETIANLLNLQVKNELMSSLIYQGVTCFLDQNGWIGASKYFFKNAQEELNHMNKIYQYLFDRNVLAKVPVTEAVKQEFKDIREVLEYSLQHEIDVTKQLEAISEASKNEKDNTTYQFIQWFLNEQIEEESKFRDILFKINLEMPKWKLDEMFEELLD